MRGHRYDRILAGTALALVMALPMSAFAQSSSPTVQPPAANPPAAIEATVPAIEQPPLPPPTAADVEVVPVNADAVNAPVAEEPQAAAAAAVPQLDPLAALDPADRPIAEKMRDLFAAKGDKIFTSKKERTAVEAFYQNRKLAPLWLDQGVENARAEAAIARVKASAADGLDPTEYKIADLTSTNPDALAEAELKLTATIITFTRHLQAGRFPYQRIGRDIEVPQQPPKTADVLAKIADATDVAQTLDSYSPPHEGYRKLKAMLAEMRAKSGAGSSQIADGPALKLTKVLTEDERVPQLRARLGVEGDSSDHRYDAKLADAVKKYQKANDLNATGALDARTIKELNGPPRDKQIDVVLANMERWRWLPRELGAAHVMVNIPEYQLRVIKNGAMIWTTRIVLGKPTLQTPLLTAEMKYITVNPTWNVPPSIIQNEYMPALAQDPTALERIGLKVIYNRDGSIHVYQPPGEGNALGRLRFNFPNRFLVYQHDTPDKRLFNDQARAYSHGCMRVQDPPKYAEVLLSIANPKEGWTTEKIKRMYGNAEQDIHFQTTIPVHMTYQTATVEDGRLVLRKDIYGYDPRMIAAIKSERGLIEMAAERPKENSPPGQVRRARAPAAAAATEPRSVSFFDALFGGPAYAKPQPQPQQPQRKRRAR
jgi:murein L,D-transpeptidase YcbB/YkuD